MPKHIDFAAKRLVVPRSGYIHYVAALNDYHHFQEIFGFWDNQCYHERWHRQRPANIRRSGGIRSDSGYWRAKILTMQPTIAQQKQ
jgi:hypothetical protein